MMHNATYTCRLCLKEIDNGVSLWSSENEESTEIIELIKYVTNLTIDIIEEWPSLVCFECLDELYKCIDFKKKCIESDTLIRSGMHLLSPKIEILEPNLTMNDEYEHSDERDSSVSFTSIDECTDNKKLVGMKEERNFNESKMMIEDIPLSQRKIEKDLEEALNSHVLPKERRKRRRNKYACVTCDKRYGNKMHLRLHAKAHRSPIELSAHQCIHCQQNFTDKSRLICHQAIHHPGMSPGTARITRFKGVHVCQDCVTIFKTAEDLLGHVCSTGVSGPRRKNVNRPFSLQIPFFWTG